MGLQHLVPRKRNIAPRLFKERLLAKQKWDSRRQTTFKVSVSSYVARISDTRGRRVIKKKNCLFVDFYLQHSFRDESVVFRYKSFRFIAKFIGKNTDFLNDFFIEFS